MLDLIFQNVYPVRRTILQHLSATEVSMLISALRCDLTAKEREKFQNPMRDISEYQDWLEEEQRAGCSVLMLGKDIPALMGRILRPEWYLRRRWRNETLTLWLAVLPPEPDTVSLSAFKSAFLPVGGQDPGTLGLVHGSQYATDSHGISWFGTSRKNDQSLDVIQYLTNHREIQRQEVRLVPHLDSFRYVFDFGEYSTVMWPPLVTGVWKSGQSVKEEPLYLMPFVNIQSPFKVEIATSDEAQEQRLYGETDAKGITVKLETPYMEEYNVLRRTPQIEIRI